VQWRVGVEKLHFRQNSENLGDRKCLGKPRTSFVGHPSAKFFQPFSDERVFQQPRDLTSINNWVPSFGVAKQIKKQRDERVSK
jgi:hypothetical protein